MSRIKLFSIIIISILSLWWLLYAWYEFIYKKSITVINTDITSIPLDEQDTIDADIAQTVVYWSNRISFSAYLQNDWLQSVFINKKNTGDYGSMIIEQLNNPQAGWSNTNEVKVKMASIYVEWDTLLIKNGVGLKDFIIENNISTVVDNNNLIIYANKTDKNRNKISYILFNNTLDKNFIVNNMDDWFGNGIFMISRKQYTAIKITWWNSLGYSSLVHINWEEKFSVEANKEIVAIPQNKKMSFSVPYINNSALEVFHITEGNQSTSAEKTLQEQISSLLNAWAIDIAREGLWNRTYSDVKKLDKNEKWEFEFTTNKSAKQWLLVLSRAHAKYITIQTDIPFAPITKDVSSTYSPYRMEISSAYDLKSDILSKELEKILGKWWYEFERGNTFMYKIQPKQKYAWNITIENVFWQVATIPLELYIKEIDQRVVTRHILANNTISVLPSNWSFQDVLIQHENIGSFPVEFQSCTIKNNKWSQDNGNGLENHLFECSGKKYTQQVKTNEFRYWKAYRTAVTLPAWMPATNAFKVRIPNGTSENWENLEHIFVKSDVWIWAKITAWKVMVRWFTFADNKPLQDGTVSVFDINWNNLVNWVIKKWPTTVPLPIDNTSDSKLLLVKITSSKWNAFVYVLSEWWSYWWNQWDWSYTISSYLEPSDVVSNNSPISFWWEKETTKIYWYSDRWLYKAWETIYFAGFVRDLKKFDTLQYLSGKTISVSIQDMQWNMIYDNSKITLDEFGWFKWSAPIPTALSLGDAIISYSLNDTRNISYTHNIKIKEYQKPTFFADITYETKEDKTSLVIKPQYFFGQAVEWYDAKVSWSLAGKDSCAYCRWWNNDPYYYNYVFNDTISTWWDFELYNQWPITTKELFSANLLQQKWYTYTLKADVIIRDTKSDEVQFFTQYIDFKPEVKVWLSWQPYEWFYNDWSKDPTKEKIEGELVWDNDNITSLTYEVYYQSYDNTQTEQWVDGSTYYVNGTEYTRIVSQEIKDTKKFTIPTDFIKKWGNYLIRVFATDDKDTILWEVQKQISYYNANDDADWLMWAVPNNYAMTVSIPKKTYNEWENIPVDIIPYQKWAHVVMTIERWDRILETIEKTLDGSQLSFTVKKWMAPNIVVNVMQIAWTDKAQWPRKEPRFYVWFGQADISTDMHRFNIDIKTDKETYKPWEQVNMTITTTDLQGNPIDTRLSVGVVDQALLQLYDLIKDPIPYFFNKMWTRVFNYTNMKLLYQSLKAFANNGSKWWGWNGWQAMFSMIRDDLEDVAFRRWWELTKDGKLELSFTLPDNLTTWVIDVIGITKDTRLATQRKSFIAAKDVIIEPNPPQFMTLWDKIQVPVKIIVSPSVLDEDKKIIWSVKITNEQWDVIDLGNFKAPWNSKILIPVEIPHARHDSNFIKLEISWTYNKSSDGVVYTIPIRSEWLKVKDSIWVINTAGEHTFTYPENYGSNVTVSLWLLPNNLIDPIIRGAAYYPFGCTEQIMSRVLAIKAAYDLKQQWWFTSSIIEGDDLNTNQWKQNIPDAIKDSINTILSRQQPDGSFGRWDAKPTENNEWKYTLSAYTYWSLHLLKNLASAPSQVEAQLKKAEEYLWNYRTTSPVAYLWYLTQKAQAWVPFTTAEKNELNASNPLKIPYGGVMRYAIAAYQNDATALLKRKQFATIPTNQDRTATSQFINQTSAYALKMNAIFRDPNSSQDDRMKAVQNLLGARNKQGDRWSTNNNAQALKAIMSLTKDNRPTKDTVQCQITIGDKNQTVTVTREKPVTIVEKNTTQSAAIKRQCDSVVIADASVTYMPKNINDQLGAAQGVTKMNYSIENPQAPIGGVTNLIGSWTNTIAGEQVAVSIYLPATYKLVDTIASMNTTDTNERWYTQLPFDMSDYNCMPDHWEVKFDRLFLYYDNLAPTSCDISIPMIKAYNGTATVMPMSIQEMYRGKVNGRKVIIQ